MQYTYAGKSENHTFVSCYFYNPPASPPADYFGLGASQIVHLSFALSGFCSMQVEHVQLPPSCFFCCAPAPQPVKGVDTAAVLAALVDCGRGSSQIWHFSLALSGFSNMHMEQVHLPPFPPVLGAPNPPNPKDPLMAGAAGALFFDRGSSQMVHFSVALSGFSSMHIEHVHFPPFAGFTALDEGAEEARIGVESSNLKANVGGDDLAASDFAFSVCSLVELAGIDVGAEGMNVKKGKASLSTLRAASLGERSVFSCSEVLRTAERTIGWITGSVSDSEVGFVGWSKLNVSAFALSSAFLGASMILFLNGES